MANFTQNPFSRVGEQFYNGLDYVINNIPGSPNFDNLNTVTIDYLSTLLGGGGGSINPILGDIVYSILPNTVNDYTNLLISQNANLSQQQQAIAISVLDGINKNTIDTLPDFFDSVDAEIAKTEINITDKTALYIATAIGKSSSKYWENAAASPGNWATYLNGNSAINYANIPFYVTASFVGALSGFSQGQMPNMGGATVLNDVGRTLGSPTSLVSSIGLTAGKVIFKWSLKPNIEIPAIFIDDTLPLPISSELK